MANKSGKTLTIFVILIIVLLVSSTSIGFFLYSKQAQEFQRVEAELEVSLQAEAKLQADLKESKKQLSIFEQKNKELDGKINNLMDEKDLQEGLNKELKAENATLKDSLTTTSKDLEKVRGDLTKQLEDLSANLKTSQEKLKIELDHNQELESRLKALDDEKNQLQSKVNEMHSDLNPLAERSPAQQIAGEVIPPAVGDGKPKVELDKIVVNPNTLKGKILSIDNEADFVITNVGLKQGVKIGDIFSVSRGDEYLGDVKVTRVQDEMSAADLIPPFSSRKIRKNDTVALKP